MSDLADHFRRMAAYNTGANTRLYDAVSLLSEEEYRRDRPAFFSSIHGTLNHILLGDRIWLTRFEGGSHPSTDLDAELYGDLTTLRDARMEMDQRLERFCGALNEAWLAGSERYTNNAGVDVRDERTILLAHLFNHQTHHRGQVHDMLSQTTVPPPSLDLHRVLHPL